jgi:hypothetical protein
VEYITHPTIVGTHPRPPFLVTTKNNSYSPLAGLGTNADRRCLEAFFITYRSFTTPRILIEKLILRCADNRTRRTHTPHTHTPHTHAPSALVTHHSSVLN